MPYTLLENEEGEYCSLNGEKILFSSASGMELQIPTEEIVYYESIRIREGTLIFFEDHMLRLYESIAAKEAFLFDAEKVYTDAQQLIQDPEKPVWNGNLRVIVTKTKVLLYLSAMKTPDESFYTEGVPASLLNWQRKSPQVKIFHDDYKSAVAEAFTKNTPHGSPYEILLQNPKQEITEGSRSNFFVLVGDTVYSPPEDLILTGITRKYVKRALLQADLKLEIKTFTFPELCLLRDQGKNPILFLTSSPFDVLPVKNIDEELFTPGKNENLEKIQKIYHNIVENYILYHNPVLPD